MNCYVCHTHGEDAQAVAVCPNCGAALCATHLDADLLTSRTAGPGQGGACTHMRHAVAGRARI